jgi:hypothetical protein
MKSAGVETLGLRSAEDAPPSCWAFNSMITQYIICYKLDVAG